MAEANLTSVYHILRSTCDIDDYFLYVLHLRMHII